MLGTSCVAGKDLQRILIMIQQITYDTLHDFSLLLGYIKYMRGYRVR